MAASRSQLRPGTLVVRLVVVGDREDAAAGAGTGAAGSQGQKLAGRPAARAGPRRSARGPAVRGSGANSGRSGGSSNGGGGGGARCVPRARTRRRCRRRRSGARPGSAVLDRLSPASGSRLGLARGRRAGRLAASGARVRSPAAPGRARVGRASSGGHGTGAAVAASADRPPRPPTYAAEAPTNSRSSSQTSRAVARLAVGARLITWSHSVSSGRGMPARTWRGRSTCPWSSGAAGTSDREMPGQRAGEQAVEETGEVAHVGGHPAGRQAVQRGVDGRSRSAGPSRSGR